MGIATHLVSGQKLTVVQSVIDIVRIGAILTLGYYKTDNIRSNDVPIAPT